MPIKLSVIIPCFNEKERFKNGLDHFLSYLNKQKYTWELILVNDGSTDNTLEQMTGSSKRNKNIKIVSYGENKGKGYAIVQGVKHANGELILFSDLDHSVPISTVDTFFKYFKKGFDVVIGSRRVKGSKFLKRQSQLRENLGRGFTLLVRILIDWEVKDATCGFKAFSNQAAKKLFSHITIYDWAFDAELLFLCKKYGYRYAQAPVKWKDVRGSKVSLSKDIAGSLLGLVKIRINDLQKSTDKFKEIFWLPAILLHMILLVNTKFTLWPEMVVYPYLLNNHFSLYRDIITNYPPTFIYFLSTLSRVLGYQPINFQILTYLIIIAVDLLIFSIGNKVFGIKAALVGLLFFIILSIPFDVNGLWFDLAVTPFILASFYFFIEFFKKPQLKNLFYSFTILTIGFFIKQQVIWVLIWFLLILSYMFRRRPKFIVPKILISIIPLALLTVFFVLFFAQRNLTSEYIYWNFLFPFSIAAPGAGYNQLPGFRQFLAIAALFLLFLPTLIKGEFTQRLVLFIAVILAAFAYRFDFFHLIPSLSILSLVASYNFKYILKTKSWFYLLLVPFFIVIFFCARYFSLNWQQPTRFFEQDILTAAKLLEIVDAENHPIYIQNGPDQLYPLSGKLPVKPWADEFPWYLERSGIQEKITSAIKTQDVQFVIYKPYENKEKYGLGSYRPTYIADYLDANYVNLIQINSTLWLKVKR